jgi:hypothetical protein
MTVATAAFLVAASGLSWAAETPTAKADPVELSKRAAQRFGEALLEGRASGLRAVLPARGKVYLSLGRLGPEEGSFGAGQVEALLGDFLASGRVRSFEIVRVEAEGGGSSLVHARIGLVDRDGRPAAARLHLAFEREGDRWVLREIKETAE